MQIFIFFFLYAGITTTLEKSNTCPFCHADNVTLDQCIPNKTLRLAIEDYIQQEANKKKDEPTEALHTGDEDPMDTNEESTQEPEVRITQLVFSPY